MILPINGWRLIHKEFIFHKFSFILIMKKKTEMKNERIPCAPAMITSGKTRRSRAGRQTTSAQTCVITCWCCLTARKFSWADLMLVIPFLCSAIGWLLPSSRRCQQGIRWLTLKRAQERNNLRSPDSSFSFFLFFY